MSRFLKGLKVSEYRIKAMKMRWGTCNINKKKDLGKFEADEVLCVMYRIRRCAWEGVFFRKAS